MQPGPGPCFFIPSSLYSPDGYLYEREAILEYILHQKKEIARQMKVMGMRKGSRGMLVVLMLSSQAKPHWASALAHVSLAAYRPMRSSGVPGERSRKSCSGLP